MSGGNSIRKNADCKEICGKGGYFGKFAKVKKLLLCNIKKPKCPPQLVKSLSIIAFRSLPVGSMN